MLRQVLTSAAVAASLLLAGAGLGEAKTCKAEFVTGRGHWRINSQFSRPTAIHAWKVWMQIHYGSRWDTWSRAEDKSEWLEDRYVGVRQFRWIVRARPCRR